MSRVPEGTDVNYFSDFKSIFQNGSTVLFNGETFTDEAIGRRAQYIADRLRDLGLCNETKIGILIGNTPLFFSVFLATVEMKAGAVLLSTHFKKRELEEHLKNINVRVIITDQKNSFLVEKLAYGSKVILEEYDPVFGSLIIAKISLPFEDILQKDEKTCEDYLTLQFTSGVNGKSKIVPRSYRNILYEITTFAETISLSNSDVIICPAPLFHTYALINGFLAVFSKGAKLILVENFNPSGFLNLVRDCRPTVFVGVPFMYALLAQSFVPQDSVDFSSFRLCFSAGAKLPREISNQICEKFRVRIHQQYGSTETGVIAVNLYLNGFDDTDSVGRPVKGRLVQIVDENGNEMPRGKEGEIKVFSPATTKGYLNMEELNSRVFCNAGYLTGDIGCIDAMGHLYITGRRSTFINVAGLKVDPFEVESVLLSNSCVRECSVVGVPDRNSGEIVRAYVVLDKDINMKDLRNYCKERLADYKVPREIEFCAALPKSPTGKVLRKYLVNQTENQATKYVGGMG